MQRNSSFGRDDETGGRPERNLSFVILFFSNFSPLGIEKLHHHAWPSQQRALLWNASREGESTSERENSGCLAAEGVSCSSSFVVKSYELKILFFLFEAWSLALSCGVAVGFKWQNVKAQKNFSLFAFVGVSFLGRRGSILFSSSFPSLWRGCLIMCVCLAYALIAYLYENRITIRIII